MHNPESRTRNRLTLGRRNLFAMLAALACGLVASGCGSSVSSRDGASSPREEASSNRESANTAAPVAQEKESLRKVSLALNWFAESEHGGFFAAAVRGFYREAGFEVTIQSGGPNAHMLEQVVAGRADFGVANADNILFARAQQVPVVALMAPLQNSPRCLLVHKASGIESFDQLQDVTLAMTPGAAFADFLRWKLPLTGVRIVPYSGNVQAFLLDPRYVQQGYTFSEPFLARQQGVDPGVLLVSDLGFNPYTSLLFTTEKMLTTEPDLVRRMVAATVSGWQDYLTNPEPTNELIHQRNPVIDLEALAFGAREIAPLMAADGAAADGIGTMTLQRWQTLEHQLVESGQLTAGAVDAQRAFTTEFLPPLKPASSPEH